MTPVGLDINGDEVGCSVGVDGIVYSAVIPVFNEEANVPVLVDRVAGALRQTGEPFEILFVDDGSSDATPRILREVCIAHPFVRAVRFSRNFGQEAAVQAAYLYARGQWLIQMDGDLQNPPEEMHKLLAQRDAGYDIVFGVRTNRQDPVLRKWASTSMRWFMQNMLRIELPKDISTFRLMRGETAKLLARFPERQKFLSALACWVGAKHTTVDVSHAARNAGKTKYNFTKLLNHTFDLIVGFSSRPLRMIGFVGFVAGVIGFAAAAWAIVERLFWGTEMGWASLFSAVMAMGGMQLLALSLIGEYVGRIFVQTQNRPIFVVAEQMGRTVDVPVKEVA